MKLEGDHLPTLLHALLKSASEVLRTWLSLRDGMARCFTIETSSCSRYKEKKIGRRRDGGTTITFSYFSRKIELNPASCLHKANIMKRMTRQRWQPTRTINDPRLFISFHLLLFYILRLNIIGRIFFEPRNTDPIESINRSILSRDKSTHNSRLDRIKS